ncbi:MAG TPA: hypothetical protein PKJ21_01910 [Anaerolineae bacterium]|nr:hypothetical protein [Anaerolineae bacterium]
MPVRIPLWSKALGRFALAAQGAVVTNRPYNSSVCLAQLFDALGHGAFDPAVPSW